MDTYEKISRWGRTIFGSLVFSGLFLAAIEGLECRKSEQPGEYQSPLTRRYEIPETVHRIPLIGEAYYPGPGQEPGAGAFYPDIMGKKGRLGRVVVPTDKEGLYLAFTTPRTTCLLCHRKKEILDMRQKKRPAGPWTPDV